MRAVLKTVADAIAMILVWPTAATCWRWRRASNHHGEAFFSFWAQLFALVPGPPGIVARRAFYRLTLTHCGRSFYIAFGAHFTHPEASIEEDVYVGAQTLIGCAKLERGCLIGSRVSILSGGGLHHLQGDGRWSASDYTQLQRVTIGAHAWIGEGAIVMADVGAGAMVAAGSVVSMPVAAGVMVAGNPARFARRLPAPDHEPQTIGSGIP